MLLFTRNQYAKSSLITSRSPKTSGVRLNCVSAYIAQIKFHLTPLTNHRFLAGSVRNSVSFQKKLIQATYSDPIASAGAASPATFAPRLLSYLSTLPLPLPLQGSIPGSWLTRTGLSPARMCNISKPLLTTLIHSQTVVLVRPRWLHWLRWLGAVLRCQRDGNICVVHTGTGIVPVL